MESKKVVCDTDVMIDFWAEKNPRHAVTKSILENQIGLDNIVLSAITKIELITGAINKHDLAKINNRLSRFYVALLNNEITIKAFDLLQLYFLSHTLTLADCLIASTSITTGSELFTYNTKDYKFISQLTLYK
jgi:predicted nucleic acid-binding protein